MTFAELDWLSVFLRSLVYIATIAVAGSVFVRTTLALPAADRIWIVKSLSALFCCLSANQYDTQYFSSALPRVTGPWLLIQRCVGWEQKPHWDKLLLFV